MDYSRDYDKKRLLLKTEKHGLVQPLERLPKKMIQSFEIAFSPCPGGFQMKFSKSLKVDQQSTYIATNHQKRKNHKSCKALWFFFDSSLLLFELDIVEKEGHFKIIKSATKEMSF